MNIVSGNVSYLGEQSSSCNKNMDILKGSCGIYAIVNVINGNCYVGQTVDFFNRRKQHLGDLLRNDHSSIRLQRSFNEHGVGAFLFCPLEGCARDKKVLEERENYWMAFLAPSGRKAPEYNMCEVSGSSLGIKRSEETSKKISEAVKKRPPASEETRKKISESNKGHGTSEETRKKIAEKLKGNKNPAGCIRSPEERARISDRKKGNTDTRGKKKSPETLKRMSDAQKKRFSTPEAIAKMQSILATGVSLEKRKKSMKQVWASPEYKEKMRQKLFERWARVREEKKKSLSSVCLST